jgi:hypothetical protein
LTSCGVYSVEQEQPQQQPAAAAKKKNRGKTKKEKRGRDSKTAREGKEEIAEYIQQHRKRGEKVKGRTRRRGGRRGAEQPQRIEDETKSSKSGRVFLFSLPLIKKKKKQSNLNKLVVGILLPFPFAFHFHFPFPFPFPGLYPLSLR